MSRNYETTLIGWAGLKVYKTFRKLHVRLMQPDDFYNEAHAAIETLYTFWGQNAPLIHFSEASNLLTFFSEKVELISWNTPGRNRNSVASERGWKGARRRKGGKISWLVCGESVGPVFGCSWAHLEAGRTQSRVLSSPIRSSILPILTSMTDWKRFFS